MDDFAILGLPHGASDEDIKRAYHKLAKQTHPDKSSDPAATEKFKVIQAAYERLTNRNQQPAPNMQEFGFHFDDMIRMFQRNAMRNAPTHQTIEIILSENDVKYGCTRKLEFDCLEPCVQCDGTGHTRESWTTCNQCAGSGRVQHHMPIAFMSSVSVICGQCGGSGRVPVQCHHCNGDGGNFQKRIYDVTCPPGVPENNVIVLKDKGSYNKMLRGRQSLHVLFRYAFSQGLRIEGRDVHVNVTLSLQQLITGFSHDLKVFREVYKLSTDGYIDPTVPVKIPGAGLPVLGSTDSGTLWVHFEVTFPSKLTDFRNSEVRVRSTNDEK